MKVKKVIGRSLLVLLCIVVVIAIIGIAQFHHRSNPKNLKQYETNNPFITGETAISAHRSGAGEFPEETLAAFRGCAENPDVQVDYFEFDLHMTADSSRRAYTSSRVRRKSANRGWPCGFACAFRRGSRSGISQQPKAKSCISVSRIRSSASRRDSLT